MISKEAIKKLSNEALLESLKSVRGRETEATAEILLHLIEVDKRKLYQVDEFSSLFAYCTKGELKYSESSTQRRIVSARAIDRFPELLELFLARELSLCNISMIAGLLTEENKEEILSGVKGRSRREAEKFLAAYRPSKPAPEKIKAVVVAKKTEEPALFTSTNADLQVAENTTAAGGSSKSNELEERRYELHFSVSQDTMNKFEEAKILLSGKYPRGALLEQIFDECLEAYLEKHSPKRREARRIKRKERKVLQTIADNSVSHSMGPSSKEAPNVVENGIVHSRPKRTRHIPIALQDKVMLRDKQRCTYVSDDGRRCDCSHDLEIHHEHAFAKGGKHEIGNLRLLCRAHNALLAEQEFGFAYTHQPSLKLRLTGPASIASAFPGL